jgi:hypothetical protein
MNSTKKTIIIYGLDSVLLETRRLVLTKSRFSAVTVSDRANVHKIITSGEIDLLVLCSSVPDREAELILGHISRLGRSEIKTLVLRENLSNMQSPPTEILFGPVDPKTFQSVVGTLVKARV